MKVPFKPLPDGMPLISKDQFLKRLKEDPAFAGIMQQHYESALALPLNEDTADLHQKATAALQTLKHHQGLWNGMQALIQVQALMEKARGSDIDTIEKQIRALCDEARDHFLDALEPERTRAMGRIAGILEAVNKLFGEP